nr:hypothetical protein [Tanacetum cinerariifolium]
AKQLQALVDGKKILITESIIRRDLQLKYVEGVDCLPNAVIFEQLTLMGTMAFAITCLSTNQKFNFSKYIFKSMVKNLDNVNKFVMYPSTIASAVICLATDQKFNFSKYIFDSMVKNLDSATKFLMFLRFVQVFLNNQLEEMVNHTWIYVPPSHIKKIFRNMKRVGKGFSGRDTPLFLTMMVQAQEALGEDITILTETHPTPIISQPSSSQPSRKQKP